MFWSLYMELVFLKSPQPITKTYEKSANGSVDKTAYPNIYEVTSITEPCDSLDQFEKLLTKHAALGHCLLKGSINRPLTKESRAGTTETNASTNWICLDLDGLPNCKDIETFLNAAGLSDVSYIVQYSASSLIENKHIRAHLYMLLDASVPAPILKQWLIDLNHKTPLLSNAMQLTKTNNSIRWPLDISVCQNDKLIYIAPPILKKIKDPYTKQPRIKLVKKRNECLTLGNAITDVTANQIRTNARVNELRESVGLPARTFALKNEDGLQILTKPGQVTTYETKSDRGFVYFNINGGDSWGYYHPEGNPKYIYNFKSEPTYLTKDLIPEYWAKAQAAEKAAEQAKEAATAPLEINSEGDTYLAFCDRRTSIYWRGTYNAQTNKLDINVARTSEIVKSFMRLHGMVGEGPIDIPEWDMVFDLHDMIRVDSVNKVINTFEPTDYMLATARRVKKPPRLIYKVIHHALGNDDAITEHFLNWLAFIVQNRCRTKTSWVFHGTEGTGKGTLFHRILKPMFGAQQTVMKRMAELNKGFNDYIESKLIIFIDEIESGSLTNEASVMADLRNYITEPTVSIERKYQVARTIENFSNWLFASNKPGAIAIPKEDRRINVGKYQPTKLVLTEDDLTQIDNELQDFYHYLGCYKVNLAQVAIPIESEDRTNMISRSETSVDEIASALLEGNFKCFIDQLPQTPVYQMDAMRFNKNAAYEAVLKDLIARTKDDGECSISRDELHTLYEFGAGNMPMTPIKFTKALSHHRIIISSVWLKDRSVRGIKVTWKDTKQFGTYLKILNPPPLVAAKLKAVK